MITAEGPIGHTTETSTDRSTDMPVDVAVDAGKVVVVWIAVDSTFSVFNPTNGEGYWYCTDSAGNIYTTIASFTDNRSFHGSGGQTIILISQLRAALTTSDVITMQAAAGLEVGFAYARAMSAEVFDFGGDRWAVSGIQPFRRRDDAVDPDSLSPTFGVSREWLILHCLANEGPVTDVFTWDSDYTEIVGDGTNTGTPSDDMSLYGGYRIDTLSTDTIDVTNTSSSTRDSTQVAVGVCAVPGKSFPNTPELDAFDRPDENPLSAAFGWDDTPGITAHFSSQAFLDGTECAGPGGSFWMPDMEACVEVWAQMPVAAEGYLHLHAHDSAAVGSLDGNALGWFQHPQDAVHNITVGRTGLFGLVGSPVMKVWATAYGDGSWLGMQRANFKDAVGVNHVFLDIGDGWEEVAAYVLDAGDGQGEFVTGRLAIEPASSAVRFDHFGGGEYPCGRRFRPDYYRRGP